MTTHYPVNHGVPLPDTISPTVPPVPQSPTNGLDGVRR
jgi:hypothetical protein